MKNVILIHGFNGIPKIYDWLKTQLEARGIEVILPSFPPQEGVVYETWESILDGYKEHITENSIVICHSIGNEFLIKYLHSHNLKVDTYIALAGFAEPFYHEDREVLNRVTEKFVVSKEEKDYFIGATKKRYAIYSIDDHLVPYSALEQYPKEVLAMPIMLPGIGHMGKKSGLEEFPKLLELTLENIQMDKFKVCIAVHLFIFKDGKILLQRRNNPNKHAYLKLGIPAGHLERGENVEQALIREMKEELGIDLKRFKLVQVMNLKGDTDIYDSYFYVCEEYAGEIINNEPDSATSLEWHGVNEPLEDMIPYEKYALDKYLENPNNHFTSFGW